MASARGHVSRIDGKPMGTRSIGEKLVEAKVKYKILNDVHIYVCWCDDGGESPGRDLYFTDVTRDGFAHDTLEEAYKEFLESKPQ